MMNDAQSFDIFLPQIGIHEFIGPIFTYYNMLSKQPLQRYLGFLKVSLNDGQKIGISFVS